MKMLFTKLIRREDRAFHMGVAIAMCVIYLTGAGTPVVVDPQLNHHLVFGARHYSSSLYWKLPFIGALVLVGTYCVLSFAKDCYRVWVACIPLLAAAAYTFDLLRPEFPHSCLAFNTTLGCILTTITVWIHYCPVQTGYLKDPDILPAAKIERAKEELSFWRTALLSCVVSFMSLIIAWVKLGQEFNQTITPNQIEQTVLRKGTSFFIGVQSVWCLLGVFAQMFRKSREALGLLEKIPSDPKTRA